MAAAGAIDVVTIVPGVGICVVDGVKIAGSTYGGDGVCVGGTGGGCAGHPEPCGTIDPSQHCIVGVDGCGGAIGCIVHIVGVFVCKVAEVEPNLAIRFAENDGDGSRENESAGAPRPRKNMPEGYHFGLGSAIS